MTGATLQTEFEFTLPQGYADDDGTLHREGTMRLATAADEIKPRTDPRVQSNPSYHSVILLSRVITDLGTLEAVTPHVVENLFVNDLEYLQSLYERVNERGADVVDAVCPDCGEQFELAVDRNRQPDEPVAVGGEAAGDGASAGSGDAATGTDSSAARYGTPGADSGPGSDAATGAAPGTARDAAPDDDATPDGDPGSGRDPAADGGTPAGPRSSASPTVESGNPNAGPEG